eukprot:UN1706
MKYHPAAQLTLACPRGTTMNAKSASNGCNDASAADLAGRREGHREHTFSACTHCFLKASKAALKLSWRTSSARSSSQPTTISTNSSGAVQKKRAMVSLSDSQGP